VLYLSFLFSISLGVSSGLLCLCYISWCFLHSVREIHTSTRPGLGWGLAPIPKHSVIHFLFILRVPCLPSSRRLRILGACTPHAEPTVLQSPATCSEVFCSLLPTPADRHHPVLESGLILSISNTHRLPGNLLEGVGGRDAKGIGQLCLKKVIVGVIYEGQQAQ